MSDFQPSNINALVREPFMENQLQPTGTSQGQDLEYSFPIDVKNAFFDMITDDNYTGARSRCDGSQPFHRHHVLRGLSVFP